MAKVCIVDDSRAASDMMTTILMAGHHSVKAYNESVGVEASIAQDRPDLILLDVVMPERNGYEVLRALKRQGSTKAVPVILVTSKGEETDVRWGLRQGAAAYVTKPFSESSLLEAITEQLAAPT